MFVSNSKQLAYVINFLFHSSYLNTAVLVHITSEVLSRGHPSSRVSSTPRVGTLSGWGSTVMTSRWWFSSYWCFFSAKKIHSLPLSLGRGIYFQEKLRTSGACVSFALANYDHIAQWYKSFESKILSLNPLETFLCYWKNFFRVIFSRKKWYIFCSLDI